MADLHTKPGVGYVHTLIERMKSDLSRLETECLGHYIAGPWAVHDLTDMAERLVNLTKPNKGHLPGAARRFDDAA